MFIWDDKVKPSSQKFLDGSIASGRVAQPSPSTTTASRHRSISAVDKRIINGQTADECRIAKRRAAQIGPEALLPNKEIPFPWMSETIDLKKERHFFKTCVIEYPTGGALFRD